MRQMLAGLLIAVSGTAHADEVRKPSDLPGRHLVFVELLGKGGLYGVGYEHAIAPWLGFGGAVSYSSIRDQQVLTASPYLHVTIRRGERHALFSEVGAILAHHHVPSPVMDWDGVADTGGGGFASLGWEYARGHFVLRTSAAIVAGEGGLAPMIGIAIGVRP